MDALRARAETDYREMVDDTATREEAARMVTLALHGELKAPPAVLKKFVAKHRELEAALEAEMAAAVAAEEARRRAELEEAARQAAALSAAARAAVPAYVPPAAGDAASELRAVRVLLEHLVCQQQRMQERMDALEGHVMARMGALEGGLCDRMAALERALGSRAVSAETTPRAKLEEMATDSRPKSVAEAIAAARARVAEMDATAAEAKPPTLGKASPIARLVRLERLPGEADDSEFALCGLRVFGLDGAPIRCLIKISSRLMVSCPAGNALAEGSSDPEDFAMADVPGANHIEVELEGGPHFVTRVEVHAVHPLITCVLKSGAGGVQATKCIVPADVPREWRRYSVAFP